MTASALLFAAALAAGPSNWPQFRGPTADGHAGTPGLPVTWSETDNVRWKAAVPGKAWSSPVVWGDQVWLTNAPADGKELRAVALDRATGRVLRDVKVFDNPDPAFCHAVNSYASCTPAVEAGRVYVHFGSAGTACLDTATGEKLWERRDLPCDHHRGPGSSPVVHGDLLFLQFDGFDVQYVVALDKKTGRTAWKADRNIDYGTDNGDLKKAYGTPALVPVDGGVQLVSPSASATVAYDPATGRELWRVRHGGMNAAALPVVGHGLVYLTTGDGGLKQLAVRLGGRGDVTGTHVVWKNNRAVPSRSSPTLVGDLIFMVNEAGLLTCVEAASGQLVWQERLKGQFTASPLVADGKLFLFADDGTGYVVEAGRSYKLLAANKLSGGCMASPAVVGKSLFVRTKTHLYCIERP